MDNESQAMNKRVLVVQDDSQMARIFCKLLQQQGYEAIPCWIYAEADRLVAEIRPDVMLVHLRSGALPEPVISGLNAIRCGKKWNPSLPVIITGGGGEPLLRQVALTEGVEYIAMPFRCDVLLAMIAQPEGQASDAERPTTLAAESAEPSNRSSRHVVDHRLVGEYDPSSLGECSLDPDTKLRLATGYVSQAVASLYAMFEPEEAWRSLGIYTLLQEIAFSREHGMKFLYPGYATRESGPFDYQKQFRATDYLDFATGEWRACPTTEAGGKGYK